MRLARLFGFERRAPAEEEWFQPPADVLVRTDSTDARQVIPRGRRVMLGVLNSAVAFGAVAPQVASAFDYAIPADRFAIEHQSDVWVAPE